MRCSMSRFKALLLFPAMHGNEYERALCDEVANARSIMIVNRSS